MEINYKWFDILMMEYCNNDNFSMQYHFHDRYELMYCINGTMETDIRGSEEKIILQSPNELIIINKNVPHKVNWTANTNMITMEFTTQSSPSKFIANSSELAKKTFDVINTEYFVLSDTKNVLYLLKKIFQNIKFQETPYFDCLVYCLFNDISDMYSEQLVPKPLGNVLINKAVKYIENNYKGTINTVALAKSVGVSQQYINKLFKPAFGMTLIEYINYVRIKISINYLRNTTLTINQISKNIGFNTPRYYARVFKKHFKMTPMEYRASVSEHFRKRDLAEWEQAEFKRFK